MECNNNCNNCAHGRVCAFRDYTNEGVKDCSFWKPATCDQTVPYLLQAAKAEAANGIEAFSQTLSMAYNETFRELNEYLSRFHICDYPMVLACMKAFAALKLQEGSGEMRMMAQTFEDAALFVSVNVGAINQQRGDAT